MIKATLLATLLATTGCATLIHRPDDNAAQTAAKAATRIVLAVPTIMGSEMAILEIKQREGLVEREVRTAKTRAAWRRRRLQRQVEELIREENRNQ